jgi:hypothetical protein
MRKVKTAEWTSIAFLVAMILVIVIYSSVPSSVRLGMALRATARWSFLWFCLATYGGALAALFGSSFQPLASRARDFGLAFAAAQFAHVALAIWLLYRSPDPFPRLQLIVFSIGVFWTYLLALLSIGNTLSAQIGIRRSQQLRRIGVEYIAFAFAFEFGGRILDGNLANALHYFPLFAAAVGGPMLRIGASIKRRSLRENTTGLLSN